jgi:hypothetical protein
MAKEATCPSCGEVLRGEGDDEYVEAVQRHAKTHGSEPPRHYILSAARVVD